MPFTISENISRVNSETIKYYLLEGRRMESVLYTRIKELCENRGISMTKLSEDLGIAASLIRKWKTTTSPSVDKVKMIAEYFGVSADYLIGLSDHPRLRRKAGRRRRLCISAKSQVQDVSARTRNV